MVGLANVVGRALDKQAAEQADAKARYPRRAKRNEGAAQVFGGGCPLVTASFIASSKATQRTATPTTKAAGVDGLDVYSAFFGPASITSSTVRRPALGELISTAMLPGGCWFFHIRVCAAGIFSQG